MSGTLYLLPSWLSDASAPEAVLTAPALERLRRLSHFVVEDERSARRFLAACRHPTPLRELTFAVLDEHTRPADLAALLAPLLEGHDVGLLSEAGLPAIADPGALLVAAARSHGVAIVPFVGPSSILLALMASGLEGQRFRFLGYVAVKPPERREQLAAIERESLRARETQIFIEAPYRNDALLADIIQSCKASTRIAVAADLTAPTEWMRVDRIEAWRARPAPPIGKRPAIFLLQA